MTRALLLLLTLGILAANASSAHAAKRALIIGFSGYSWAPLPGVKADISKITSVLKDDYLVTVIDDETKTRLAFREKWDAFVDSIKDKDEVIVYYSGHGIDVDGTNYLIPLDAQEPNGTRRLSSISDDLILLRKLINEIQEKTPALSLFIIDACRTNPYNGRVRGPAASGGLNRERLIERYSGYTVVFFSADFDQPALDRMPGKDATEGSPFAYIFARSYKGGKNKPLMFFLQVVAEQVQQLVMPQDQLPTTQGMAPHQICLAPCDSNAYQLLFANVQGPRNVINTTDITINDVLVDASTTRPPDMTTVASKSTKNTLSNLKELGNAIFVGKTSQMTCTKNDFSDAAPFGCDFLKKAASVAKNDGRTLPQEVEQAVALTDINLRRSVPRVDGNRAYYDCSVGVVKRSETVRLKGVAAYQYAGDTFLWAIVDRPALKQCKS